MITTCGHARCKVSSLVQSVERRGWGGIARLVGVTCLFYPLSIGLTFYQKWVVKDFSFPLMIVTVHFVLKFVLSLGVRLTYSLVTGKQRITLGLTDFFCKIAPTGIAASIDIGLSNWSLELITVSLYTMAKSTSIVFVLIFALAFSLERFNWFTFLVPLFISSGLFLFTYQSTQFNLTGFVLVEVAACCAGIRWTLSQVVTQRKESGLHNPIDMIFHVQPWMIATMVPIALIFEGGEFFSTFSFSGDILVMTGHLTMILIGGLIAFLMEITEYLLLTLSSSLTLNVCGVVKEILILVLAHHYQGDQMSIVNLLGLILCMAGVVLHLVSKTKHEEPKETLAIKRKSDELQEMLIAHSDDEFSSSDNDEPTPTKGFV